MRDSSTRSLELVTPDPLPSDGGGWEAVNPPMRGSLDAVGRIDAVWPPLPEADEQQVRAAARRSGAAGSHASRTSSDDNQAHSPSPPADDELSGASAAAAGGELPSSLNQTGMAAMVAPATQRARAATGTTLSTEPSVPQAPSMRASPMAQGASEPGSRVAALLTCYSETSLSSNRNPCWTPSLAGWCSGGGQRPIPR